MEQCRALPVTDVGDGTLRMMVGGARRRPMHARGTMPSGLALTVKTRFSDNLIIHRAITLPDPGNVVLRDAGDLICVPFAEAILATASAKHAAEEQQVANIAAGTNDVSWVDASLRRLGCEGLD